MAILIELLRKFLARHRIGAESAVWLAEWERSFPLSSGSPVFVLCVAAKFHLRLPVDDVSSFQAGWQPPAPFLQAQNRTKLKMSVGDHVLTLALQGGLVITLSPDSTAVGHRTALTSQLCPSTVFLARRLDLHRDLRLLSWFIVMIIREESQLLCSSGWLQFGNVGSLCSKCLWQ